MNTYTIKQIADMAGVTTRTLRYYDEVGLLGPAQIGENGYRYYDHANLLLLQQILFYRELDVPVKEIQRILQHPEFDQLRALEEHRAALQQQAERLNTLIDTIDQTIATLKGEWIMSDQEHFEGFDEKKYQAEAEERWGDTQAYAQSQKRWGSYTAEQKEAIKTLGREINARMVGTPTSQPCDADIQAAVAEYYEYLNKNFYTADVEFLRGLAEMWATDPRFAVNYDGVRAGGAEFVRKAVNVYCDNNK